MSRTAAPKSPMHRVQLEMEDLAYLAAALTAVLLLAAFLTAAAVSHSRWAPLRANPLAPTTSEAGRNGGGTSPVDYADDRGQDKYWRL